MFSRRLLNLAALVVLPALALASGKKQAPATADAGALGAVRFQNSCASAVTSTYDRGIAQLHSFEYESARQTFQEVAQHDPSCAMAYWGIAMTYYHQLWEDSNFPAGAPAFQQAQKLADQDAKITPREKGYIAALGKIYSGDQLPLHDRVVQYQEAMAQLHQQYPDDLETTAFYALSIAASASSSDKTYQQQSKCGRLLEPLFAKYPQHPGVTHYLIHCYDNPLFASRALHAARSYAKIAPASAHAQHMPSHIFTRVGSWQESIDSNLAAAEVARKMEATSAGQARGERLHAMDYLEYAYLQQGDVQHAKGVVDLLKQLSAGSAEVKNQYAASAIPARYYLELSKWEDARDLTVDPSWSPTAQANLWMAKGIGAARSGDVKTAETAVAELAKLRDKLKQSNPQDTYWSDQIEVQRLEVSGWLAQAKGEIEEARSELNSAADLEDGMEKRPVTPGSIIPAREMLAQLWLQQKHPDEALTEFESVLRTSPKRFNAVYGAATSAASIASGATALIDSQQAALRYYRELVEIAGEHKQRPELKEAARFISAHSGGKVNEAVK